MAPGSPPRKFAQGSSPRAWQFRPGLSQPIWRAWRWSRSLGGQSLRPRFDDKVAWAVLPYLVNAAYCMGYPTLHLLAELLRQWHCWSFSAEIQDRLELFHDPLEKHMHDVSGLSNPAWHQVRQGCPTPHSCQASFKPVLVRELVLRVLVDVAEVGPCRLLTPFRDPGLAGYVVLSNMTRFNSSGLSNPKIHAAKVRRARSSRSSTGFFHCRSAATGDVHSPCSDLNQVQGFPTHMCNNTSLPGLSNPHVQNYISVRV